VHFCVCAWMRVCVCAYVCVCVCVRERESVRTLVHGRKSERDREGLAGNNIVVLFGTSNTNKEAHNGQAKPGWVAVHADTSPSSGLVQIIWLQPMAVGPQLVRPQAF